MKNKKVISWNSKKFFYNWGLRSKNWSLEIIWLIESHKWYLTIDFIEGGFCFSIYLYLIFMKWLKVFILFFLMILDVGFKIISAFSFYKKKMVEFYLFKPIYNIHPQVIIFFRPTKQHEIICNITTNNYLIPHHWR